MAIDDALEAQLRALADRAACADLVYRYARGVSSGRPELIVSCFAPDGSLDLGFTTLEGIEAIRAYFAADLDTRRQFGRPITLDHTDVSTPLMTNVHVELNGDQAEMEATGIVVHAGSRGANAVTVVRGVRYTDACARFAGGWRLRSRVHHALWGYEVIGPPLRIV